MFIFLSCRFYVSKPDGLSKFKPKAAKVSGIENLLDVPIFISLKLYSPIWLVKAVALMRPVGSTKIV